MDHSGLFEQDSNYKERIYLGVYTFDISLYLKNAFRIIILSFLIRLTRFSGIAYIEFINYFLSAVKFALIYIVLLIIAI